MTSIFYMLTNENPISYFILNRSDIMHYFHIGSPLTYWNGCESVITHSPGKDCSY